ncbi:MAG: MarR family EPS-associated transcriptional regulator [Rhodocyclaceae bacterium]|jgi:EPS-associated MarR family transcriptional regulator|nr:MarR family EPS-associated transcriptional regulator [Rhodocyclaceae bacterium]MCA3059059.1 MarR family EPS-associated transcriptional regulator [Rhodocyclaceae bacterium]MCA3082445.1 MarR family EPS-associated transcriptional regulator [Rhodocyclaceae bacterium]MCE2724770.1 MarR family EPS-associated transcriptional regulator [Betaproteobacteria bacterium]
MPPSIDQPISENHLRLLRLLDTKPELSQRDLSRELGMSLGKVNYCLNALVDKGLVKVGNFRNNDNKLSYAYLLTPRGIKSKAVITAHFLQRKMAEYEALKAEIAQLKLEVEQTAGTNALDGSSQVKTALATAPSNRSSRT